MIRNKTTDSIAKAIYELLQTEQIQNIRTMDIVRKANISKKTFYNHFKDKYEVCTYIYDQLHDMHADEIGWNVSDIIESSFRSTYSYMVAHRNFFLNTLCYSGQNNLLDYFMNLSFQQWLKEIESILGVPADARIIDALYFTHYGQAATLYAMLRGAIPIPDEAVQYHKQCLPKILFDIFESAAAQNE